MKTKHRGSAGSAAGGSGAGGGAYLNNPNIKPFVHASAQRRQWPTPKPTIATVCKWSTSNDRRASSHRGVSEAKTASQNTAPVGSSARSAWSAKFAANLKASRPWRSSSSWASLPTSIQSTSGFGLSWLTSSPCPQAVGSDRQQMADMRLPRRRPGRSTFRASARNTLPRVHPTPDRPIQASPQRPSYLSLACHRSRRTQISEPALLAVTSERQRYHSHAW